MNKNYTTINEAEKDKDAESPLNYFRKIVQLRKNNFVLVYGKYTLLDKNNPDVYAYTRELNGTKFLILLNFKSHALTFNINVDMRKAKRLLGNYSSSITQNTLQPYEAVIYQLN